MDFPLVTVIIPTYNYASYIKEAIASVLLQTYPQEMIEVIIVDDGSTDNTCEVVATYSFDSRIKYYYQANAGKAAATREAIKLSNGKYIFNLDADDFFYDDRISKAVLVFEHDKEIVHVSHPARIVKEGREGEKENIPDEILKRKMNGRDLLIYFYVNKLLYGGGSTFAAKADVLKKMTIPDEVDMYIDEFLLLQTLLEGSSYFFDEALTSWVIHANNYSKPGVEKNARLLKSSTGVFDYLTKNCPDKRLLSLYELQHRNREIFFLEQNNKKRLTDIFTFFNRIILSRKYSWSILKRYKVFNRMLPTGIIHLLK